MRLSLVKAKELHMYRKILVSIMLKLYDLF